MEEIVCKKCGEANWTQGLQINQGQCWNCGQQFPCSRLKIAVFWRE